MKKIIFIFLMIFSSRELFAQYCYVADEFWKTGGISACSYGNGLNNVGLTIMHSLAPSKDPNDSCPGRAYVCENRTGTDIPSGASNLPDWVSYNPNPQKYDYPYTCSQNKDTWYSLFEGASGEGYYSCDSGSATYLPNVEVINPNNQDNPLTCKSGFTQTAITGFSPSKKGGYTHFQCVPQYNETGDFTAGDLEEISDSIKSGADYMKLLQDPLTVGNDDGSSSIIMPDGSKYTIYPNGALVTEYPSGVVKIDYLFGENAKPKLDGSYIKYQGEDSKGNKYYEMNNGAKYLLEPSGDLTKYFNQVTITEKVDYKTWKPLEDYGYSSKTGTGSGSGTLTNGSSGTGSGSATSSGGQYLDGTNIGDTSNESGKGGSVPQIPQEEEENPEAKSCNDPNLTYQQKMFCEINRGFRKINQEDNPEMSINNMLANYNQTMNRNEKAIAYNLYQASIQSGSSIFKQIEQNKKLDQYNTLNSNESSNFNAMKTGIDSLKNNLSRLFPSLSNGGSGTGTGTGSGSVANANLDQYFQKDSTLNTNIIDTINNTTDSQIDSLINVYSQFTNNISNSFTTISNQITSTKSLITGVNNIFDNQKIVTCPISYQFDLTSYDSGIKNIDIDICKYFSQLSTLGYFIVYVFLMFVLIFSTFIILGVLSK